MRNIKTGGVANALRRIIGMETFCNCAFNGRLPVEGCKSRPKSTYLQGPTQLANSAGCDELTIGQQFQSSAIANRSSPIFVKVFMTIRNMHIGVALLTTGTYSMKRILITGFLLACSGCALSEKAGFGRKQDDTVDRSLSLARLSERHGNVQQAEQIYTKIAEKHPKNTLAPHRLGVIAAKRNEFDTAEKWFAAAQAAGLNSAELHCDIGYTHYIKNDLEAAEHSLHKALAIDPQCKRAHNTLGLVLAESGRFSEALASFRRAVDESEALANLAYVQVQLGALAEAEKNYHRALELNQNLKSAGEGLLQLATLQGQAPRAIPPSSPRQLGSQPESAVVQSNHGAIEAAQLPHAAQPNPTGQFTQVSAVRQGPEYNAAPSESDPAVATATLYDPRVRTVSRDIPLSGMNGSGYISAAAEGPGTPVSLKPQGFSPSPQPPHGLLPSRNPSWPSGQTQDPLIP